VRAAAIRRCRIATGGSIDGLAGDGDGDEVEGGAEVGEAQLGSRNVGVEASQLLQYRDPLGQQRTHRALDLVADLPDRREHLRIEASGRQLEVKVNHLHQLSPARPFQRIRRQQRHIGVCVFEVVEDDLRLAEVGAVLDFQAGYFPVGFLAR
jgi:hypothetical protein